MMESNDGFSPLLELLKAIGNMNLKCDEMHDPHHEKNKEVISRGLPSTENTRKYELQKRIISNQKKKTLNEKIDAIKGIVQKKDESKGLLVLASYLNEILEPKQKSSFVMALNGQRNCAENPEYIPFDPNIQSGGSYLNQRALIERSGEPFNSIIEGNTLDSFNLTEGANIKIPIESHYNEGETYLIYKGIYFSRTQMTKHYNSNDTTILRELKTKGLLHIVLSVPINNDMDYITTLVNTYPRSFDEIKFIMKEDRDVILKSTIFVKMAERNIQHLYDFLLQMAKIVDKTELSRACDQCETNGVGVSFILQKDHPADVRNYAERIARFLNRYRQSITF